MLLLNHHEIVGYQLLAASFPQPSPFDPRSICGNHVGYHVHLLARDPQQLGSYHRDHWCMAQPQGCCRTPQRHATMSPCAREPPSPTIHPRPLAMVPRQQYLASELRSLSSFHILVLPLHCSRCSHRVSQSFAEVPGPRNVPRAGAVYLSPEENTQAGGVVTRDHLTSVPSWKWTPVFLNGTKPRPATAASWLRRWLLQLVGGRAWAALFCLEHGTGGGRDPRRSGTIRRTGFQRGCSRTKCCLWKAC